MSNYFRYGNTSFGQGVADVQIRHTTKFNEAMKPLAIMANWSIDLWIAKEANKTLASQLNIIEAAFTRHGQNVSFFHHEIKNGDTLGGIRVTVPPTYGSSRGAELVNYRTMHVEIEAELPFAGAAQMLVSFDEQVTYGAGRAFGYIEVANGPAIRYRRSSKPLQTAIQRGSAVGYGVAPNPDVIAPPLFPNYLIKDPDIVRGTPKRIGDTYMEFPVSWEYTFESPSKLSRAPNRWRGR